MTKGERKPDLKLGEMQDVNSIQNRLKKLIGVNKQTHDHKLVDSTKHSDAVQKKKDSLGISEHMKKEKKEKSVNKKKNSISGN